MDFKRLRTDPSREREGVWCGKREIDEIAPDLEWEEGGELLVARANNEDFRHALAIDIRKNGDGQRRLRQLRRDDPKKLAEIVDQATIRCMARHVLLDWRGITEDGVEVPYSPEKAEEYLEHVTDFRDLVSELASDVTLYQEEEAEAVAGNSSSASNGSTG